MIATAQFTISIVNDGTGIDHVEISYAIHTSATTPPGNPITQGGVVIVDRDGRPLTDGNWQSTVPEVPAGQFLWTRTITYYTSGDFSIAYVVGYTGINGQKGDTGVGIVGQKEQWYLSTSNTKLQGDDDGWSYEEPDSIPEGKYLWGRWEFTMSDGTVTHSDAIFRSTINGVITELDKVNGYIEQKIWQTDFDAAISDYDESTVQGIRDRVSKTEQDISGITSTVSDVQTSLATKADNSTVTTLANTVSQNEQTAQGFRQTVESTYAKLTDLDNVEIGARNLVLASDKEVTCKNNIVTYDLSEFGIDVLPQQEIVISADIKSTAANSKLDTFIRTASSDSWNTESAYIENIGTTYARYTTKAKVKSLTEGKQLKWIAFRTTSAAGGNTTATYSIKNVKVEIGNKATTWSPAPEDLMAYSKDLVDTTKSEIKQTTDSISLQVSKKVGTDEIISKINQTPESITIDASKVDLIGNVTFSMLDNSAQTKINNIESAASLANDKANIGLGMKTNYSTFSSQDPGEAYLHGYTNGVAADVDGYVYWNQKKITVPKKMLNPNAVIPYWTTIYIVLRLTGASTTTGTLYMVWYNSGWKYAATPTPSAVGGNWTWTETTDIVLGQFVETGSELQVVDAYLYNPPRNASHIQTTGANSYQYAYPGVKWVSDNGTNVVTAKNIVNNWATDATKTTTTIKGGLIQAHTILTEALATNAIMSANYNSGTADSDAPSGYYSTSGSFLDLATGNFYTPNFSVKDSNVYVNGEVNMLSGRIGDVGNSYWSLGTQFGEDWSDKAAIIANGDAIITTGKLSLLSDSLHSFNNGDYIYKDGYWYDFGLQVPDFNATGSINGQTHKQNFLYIRRISSTPTDSTVDADWNYLFRVDKQGDIYWNGNNISSGTYLPLGQAAVSDVKGTVTFSGNVTFSNVLNGTASAANKLSTTKTIITKLDSTTAVAYTGESNITPGVSGTLGVGHGGTGATTFTSGAVLIGNGSGAIQTRGIKNNTTAGALGWSTNANDTVLITSNTLAYWDGRYQSTDNKSNLQYVKLGKLGTVVTHDYDEFINTTGGTINGGLTVTDLNAGNLVVTGSGTFTNGLFGDLTGDVTGDVTGNVVGNVSGTAGSVKNNLKIQLNSGTTEGTNQFTYNGSAAKNINITKTSIGLGNVENTAISTWAGSANLTTTKVGTLAAAAVKGVDTSISAASTSGNLPTSAAVASFVEGKGYVTSSGVTSARVQATSPVVSSQNTAQSTTLNTTISLADGYGDTKNPYGTKTANYVLAGPSSGNAAVPSFRKLVAADIPSITKSKISDFPTTWELTNITSADDLKAIEGLTGTSGMLKKTAANTWALTTVVAGLSIDNDVITVTKSDGTTEELSVIVTGQIVSGATILTNSSGQAISLGSASAPVYFSNGVPAQANTIPTIALNGSNTTSPSFYSPTGAGTSGQYLKSNGSGAPTWATFSKSTVGLGNVDNTADANKAVLTATKFATAQSVTLTGDTTGTASSQAGWSIETTTKLFTGTLESATALTTSPGTGKIRYSYNVNNGTTGLFNHSSNANSIITLNRHNGNYDSQIGFSSDGDIYYRSFNGSALNNTTAWKTMLNSSNYTSYTVEKDGTGATGNWGISITGNATTATTATYSYYPKIVATNELRFDVGTKPSSATSLHIGHKWSDGTADAKISRYIFKNGNAQLAEVEASTFYGALSGNATTATTASRVSSAGAGTANTNRHVWFSDSSTETARNHDDNFMYNPSTNVLTVGSITGTATYATTTADTTNALYPVGVTSGATTTLKRDTSITMTGGAISATSVVASSYLAANSGNSGTSGGLALYGPAPTTYGITMRQTTNQGKHGYVQGDWAIYNHMSGATNRGFIWKAASTSVASIDGLGNASFNGEVAIGTTGTNIVGSCSLSMDRDLGCLNFIFN